MYVKIVCEHGVESRVRSHDLRKGNYLAGDCGQCQSLLKKKHIERTIAMHKDPEFAERHRQRTIAMHQDPEFAERNRERMIALHQDAEFAKRRRQRMIAMRKDPESRRRNATATANNPGGARGAIRNGLRDPEHKHNGDQSHVVALETESNSGRGLFKIGKADRVRARYGDATEVFRRTESVTRTFLLEQLTLQHLRQLVDVGISKDDAPKGGHTECFYQDTPGAADAFQWAQVLLESADVSDVSLEQYESAYSYYRNLDEIEDEPPTYDPRYD